MVVLKLPSRRRFKGVASSFQSLKSPTTETDRSALPGGSSNVTRQERPVFVYSFLIIGSSPCSPQLFTTGQMPGSSHRGRQRDPFHRGLCGDHSLSSGVTSRSSASERPR